MCEIYLNKGSLLKLSDQPSTIISQKAKSIKLIMGRQVDT